MSFEDSVSNKTIDSLFVIEFEAAPGKDKVLHAEPLYIDLIRDLGARKGEKEWNFGMGITDNLRFDSYEALVEYEWAPIDRLGLEVEIPLLIYAPQPGTFADSIPSNKIESLKMAGQWSFFVSEKIATSMALGYINEFELTELASFGKPLFKGNLYNPFFIAAKRWGTNFHTLIYTGPRIEQHFANKSWDFGYEWHSNFHYMIPGTRNFIGVEVNKYFENDDIDITLRPQMRVEITESVLVGVVAGIPIGREEQRLSSFIRVIWEPKEKLHRTSEQAFAPMRRNSGRHF